MLKRFSEYKYSLAKTLEPIIIKLHNKIKILAEKKPYASMAIMFAVLLLNTFFVFRYLKQENKRRAAFLLSNHHDEQIDSLFSKKKTYYANTLPLSKFFEIQKFKDSLEYYRAKQKLTHEDSLNLIKLLKSYEFIDPEFINQLESSSIEKK